MWNQYLKREEANLLIGQELVQTLGLAMEIEEEKKIIWNHQIKGLFPFAGKKTTYEKETSSFSYDNSLSSSISALCSL